MTDLREPSTEAPRSDEAQDEHGLRERVLYLAQRLQSLADPEAEDQELDDVPLCHQLALSVKPYVDRLVVLHRLLNPMDRIVEKRERIETLREEIAEDIAQVEDASRALDDESGGELLEDLQVELSAIKKDRRLFAVDDDAADDDDDEPDDDEDVGSGDDSDAGRQRLPLSQRPVAERFRLLLGPRFIDLERLGQILGGVLPEDESAHAARALESVWDGLLRLPSFRELVRAERLRPLRKALQGYALVYRTPVLPAADGTTVPCTLEALRDAFGPRFVQVGERSLWYRRLPFYRTALDEGHWALLDGHYLNCTFKTPKIRLGMYARANDLPAETLRQKSVLEDVYDRVVVDDALDGPFFDNCNSMTRTSYQAKDEPTKKQVHVYYRDALIRISGKRGIPHWRPGKPRWPAVLPAIVFSSSTSEG